ncbi:DUF3800 domain-containing protein [Caulobacter sp. DWR1-3-2b1]|uniref:DUF3800 domain-containing protein n=1 Tax=Caulobacter sp. DWR1-3-2b1 TaxID=2804670 RepID=UPI003CF6DB88
MTFSYVAYIDESGDEGFVFKPFPERASSQWFVLSALMIPAWMDVAEVRNLHQTIGPIESNRGSPIHFHKLSHEQRVTICASIGASNFKTISICIDKTRITNASLAEGYALYFYATRYLLERASWLARDELGQVKGGDGKVKFIFSNRSRMSYDDLKDYVDKLRTRSDVSVHWPAVDSGLITTKAHKDLVGLRAVDCVASGIRFGLELSNYGFCEDRYARLLAPSVYQRGGKTRPYGMKFFPSVPDIEPHRDDRYKWLNDLFPK